jgi:RND family efflux transporter MFP subunit
MTAMSPPAREWLKRLLLVPPIAIGVAVLAWQLRSGAQPEQGALEEVARAVRVIEVEPLTFVPRAVGYGTARPDQVWEAVAEVGGKITEKHPGLQRGRLLEAGTVILRIDPASYELAVARRQAALDSARAELVELEVRQANTEASIEIERRALSLAERDLERSRTLLGRGNTSQALVDEAETAVLERQQRLQELENQLRLIPAERSVLEASIALQQAELEEARLDLERTTIRMPFDGRVAEVDVEPTQFVGVGQVVAVADGIDVAEIEAQFPIGQLAPLVRADVDISTLPAGELSAVPRQFGLDAAVRLRTQGITAAWDARFDRIGEGMDPQTRTMGVIVAVDEPYRKAIPGKRPPLVKDMFVEVELRGRPWEGAIVVPRIATHRNDDGETVLYLADGSGRLEIRPVTLGPVQGDLAVVEAGLEPGERVVVSDLIPAIAGMRLDASPDTALAARLRRDADGARGPLSQ